MKYSIVSTGHDVRPHPSARAGPPVSTTGRWWIAVTVAGPFLALALLVLPGQVLADRLPDGLGGNGLIAATIWGSVAAVAFALLLYAQFARAASAPAAHWGWVVPAVYMLVAAAVGTYLARVSSGLDQAEWDSPAWAGFAIYGSMIAGAVAGSLLAQRVVAHLPRAPIPRARAAWVEVVPVMGTSVIGYHNLVMLALVTAFLTWVDGNVWFGLAAATWMVAVFIWTTSIRVAATPDGVRVTQGAFGLIATTRSVPLADITRAEVAEVTNLEILKHVFCSLRFYVFRPGPALRLQLRSGRTVTIGLRSHTQARQVADLLTTWQLEQTAV